MSGVAPQTVVDGRYRVLERLGSGGMADVFCAEDLQLGRRVALKLLHGRFAADDEFVERFRREAQSAAGLQHPNVVGIYDRGEWDGTWYIAMEYLPGRNLKQLLREEAPLDPVRAVEIAIQILKAARFAHKRGIIHRDLKPHNVIVDDEDRAKVTDFGIARAGASEMTETGSILGTAQYLSPEQAQGHAVSARSDLYAVGVILYEMLTGRVPFEADAAVSIALKHVTEAPAPPSALNPAVPAELDQIVLWALEKDAERRPPDADAFIAALEQARKSIVAGTAGEATAAFTPPAAAAYGDGAATAYAPPPPLEPDDELPAPPEEDDRSWVRWLVAGILLLLIAGGVLAYVLTRPEKLVVPKVVGDTLEVAQARLQGDYQVEVIRRTSRRPADQVISQIPLAGEKVDKGETVTLTVSNGPGQGFVPSVIGQKEATARKRIRRAGFKTTVTRENSDDVAKGRVISTSPDGGSQLDKGRTVTLVVSRGPELVTVPDVVGQDAASARDAVSGAGFTVQQSERESSEQDPGTVLEQNPGSGVQAPKGSTVSLVVAKEGPVAVPDVTGADQNDAVNELSAAGFQPTINTQEVKTPDEDGKVIKQSPAGGSRQKKGTKVTLVVGRFTVIPDPGEQPPTSGGTDTPSPDTGNGTTTTP
jgi:beta-lactam-binding protein with PASTA domain/predicted Ser/Thr protein kinase